MKKRYDTAFAQRVLTIVRRIPVGKVATYGEIAAAAGHDGAARAVGNIMKGCDRPDVPCHRVIAAGGRLGGYGGSESLKRSLLAAEGVTFRGTRIRMDDFGWKRTSVPRSKPTPKRSSRPQRSRRKRS